MKIAAGMFIVRKDFKILLGHPTHHRKEFWSIPKGGVEPEELHVHAAIRETFEETNVDLSTWKIIHNLDPVPYPKSKKILFPFVIFESQNDIKFDEFELKCNSMVPEDKGGFPEMDSYQWLTLEEAKPFLHITQAVCIEKVQAIINKIKTI